jgi:hypothetical protein
MSCCSARTDPSVTTCGEEESLVVAASQFRGDASRGYRATELRKILGGNFMRVAQATWPTTVGRA